MFKFTTAALAAIVAFGAAISGGSSAADAGHRHRGANVAAGIVLGTAALAVLANSSRTRAEYDERASWRQHCRSLYRRCSLGSDYACQRLETNGCTE